MNGPSPRFLSLDEMRPADAASSRKRWVPFAVAGGVTMGGLLVALAFGTLGYDTRRSSMHEARLRGILVQTPTVYQVTEGLKEKAPLLQIVGSGDDLRASVERWGGNRKSEILEKARLWPQLRVYSAGDMIYFIFFDSEHIMRDYVFVTARGA